MWKPCLLALYQVPCAIPVHCCWGHHCHQSVLLPWGAVLGLQQCSGGWFVVRWHPHERQEPRFPTSTLLWYEIMKGVRSTLSIFISWGWWVYWIDPITWKRDIPGPSWRCPSADYCNPCWSGKHFCGLLNRTGIAIFLVKFVWPRNSKKGAGHRIGQVQTVQREYSEFDFIYVL